MIDLFIQADANLNGKNFDGRNLGHVAASQGHKEILLMLAKSGRYDWHMKDRHAKSTLDLVRWNINLSQEFKKQITDTITN